MTMRTAMRLVLMLLFVLTRVHAQTQGTPGTGRVAIGGSEHSVLITPGHQVCYPRVGCYWVPPVYGYDAGTVTITVNGHADSVNYGKGDTSSSVAQKLLQAIYGDTAASVTATLSGTTINLQATSNGVSTNYPLSATTVSTTSYGPSFTATPSGATLTGGSTPPPPSPLVNVLTQHNDNFRTGQNTQEALLTPANVNSGQFGKLFSLAVDGQVYAQPLYVSNLAIAGGTHNVVFVATEHDSVYAFEADSGAQLWKASMVDGAHGVPSGTSETTINSADVQCDDINPQYGITATPVIDLNTNTIYVEAKSKTVGMGGAGGDFFHRLHALDMTTGNEKFSGPVVIGGTSGGVTFDPFFHHSRPGLLLMNGKVYIGFASHCDHETYYGWVFAYDSTSLQQLGVFVTTPVTLSQGGIPNAGGIWMAGSGLAGDGADVYAATGNGNFDTSVPPADVADSIIKLNFSSGNLGLADWFTPWDQNIRLDKDLDLGSGGVLLLPDQPGAHPHELVQAGKIGTGIGQIYVLDRDHMGRYCASCNINTGNTQIVQDLSNALNGFGLWSMPAYWNNKVYFWGAGDNLRAFSLNNGQLNFAAASSDSYGYPGATPSISANGVSNGIVWSLKTDSGNSGAVLRAHDAGSLNLLYSSDQNSVRDNPGAAVKFAVPTIANGKVYAGAGAGASVQGCTSLYGCLTAYGLFGVTLSPTSLEFDSQPVNTTSAPQNLTMTNPGAASITISGLTTTGEFAQNNNCPALLAPGAICSVSVTFTPSVGGLRNGTLTVLSNGVPISTAGLMGSGSPLARYAWRAQSLPHAIGRPDNDGWSATVGTDPQGWLQYGPYVTDLALGNNVAFWNLMIDNNNANNDGVVVLDVNDATTQTEIARQTITRRQFASTMTYQPFAIPFVVDSSNISHKFEFRIWWPATAYIREQYAGYVHPQWNAQDPALGHVLGRADGDGWSVNVQQDSPNGWMQYGPYTTTVQPGDNLAVWNLLIDNNTADQNGIVILDAFDTTTLTRIASTTITRPMFQAANTYETFALPFTVDQSQDGHTWEFRIWWIGWAYTKEQVVGFTPVP
jgi:hypothetical protein